MRLLGVDPGGRRIGLAISDPSGTLARPLRVIRVSSLTRGVTPLTQEVATLRAEDDGLDGVVVGLPRGLDGQAHDQTDRVLRFVDALRRRCPVPIHLQDERLSSLEAEQRLAETERDWRRRKPRLDAAAAALILQEFLDAGRGRDAREERVDG